MVYQAWRSEDLSSHQIITNGADYLNMRPHLVVGLRDLHANDVAVRNNHHASCEHEPNVSNHLHHVTTPGLIGLGRTSTCGLGSISQAGVNNPHFTYRPQPGHSREYCSSSAEGLGSKVLANLAAHVFFALAARPNVLQLGLRRVHSRATASKNLSVNRPIMCAFSGPGSHPST